MTHDSANEAAADDAPRLTPGQRVGDKYVITHLLGVGANGAVYEAMHDAIGHRVAIKVVHQALATRDDIIERFRREARVCGTIRDRHVGQVYDVGQLSDGAPYMVMELQEGKPLEDLLKRKTLPIATVIDAGRQLLSGLAAAHAVDVVHRDVKPANLMLNRERNGDAVLKLVDFGISKRVTRDITERNVTMEGTVVGSPDYMPPEQLRGGEVDYRADIYATGVVLYEAVTGRMPFDAPSMTELLAAILRDPVTSPREFRPDCPPELERVILRAMSRNRADRFESATEMERALAQIVVACNLPEGAKVWQVDTFPDAGSTSSFANAGKATVAGDYTIETERVRTVELQLPKQTAWPLYAGGAAVVVVGLVLALSGGSDEQPTVTALPASTTVSAPALQPGGPALVLDAVEPVVAPAHVEPSQPPHVVASAANTKAAAAKPSATAEDDARPSTKPTVRVSEQAPKSEAPPRSPPPRRETAAQATDVSAWVGQANAAFMQGQLPKALALYRQIVAAAPGHTAAWRGLGMTAMKMGRRQDARAAFEKYLKLAPSAPDAARIREKLAEL